MTTIPGPRRRSPAPPPDSGRHVPSIATDLAASHPATYSQAPTVETPDAYDYYRLAIAGTNGDTPHHAPPSSSSHPNGLSKSFETPTPRSASTVSVQPGPRSARSNPALPSQKRSVRDIAAQFNQAGNGHVPVPARHEAYRSASMPAHKVASTLQAPGSPPPDVPQPLQAQRNKLQKPSHHRRKSMEDGRKRLSKLLGMPSGSMAAPSRPPLERNSSSQQILFGEVAGAPAESTHVGHGIPRKMPRRGSEGSMRRPNAMFPRPSHLDLSNATSPNIPKAPYTADHHRSRSDMTDFNFPFITPQSLESMKNGLPPELLQNLEDGRYTHLNFPNGSSVKDRRPVTPPSNLSFPQMAAESVRLGAPGEQPRLKAYIRDSPPKTSPPLRSSRPRQQLSSHTYQDTEPPESAPRRMSALQELSNAVYQGPRSAARLEVNTSNQLSANGLGPNSAGTTDDGATDFEMDTPPASALPRERSESLGNQSADFSRPSRLGPALTVRTQPVPPKSAPMLKRAPEDSPPLPDESKESGMIQIMLGDRSLLTPQTGRSAPPNIGSMIGAHRNSDATQSPETVFTPVMLDRPSNPRAYSWMSANPATPGRLTVDSSGYNAIHNLLAHYDDGNAISPQMIDELQPHVVLAESDLSPQDAVDEMLRQIDYSKGDTSKRAPTMLPGPAPELNLQDEVLQPQMASSTASHETDIEDGSSFIQDDDQNASIEPHPRKDSGALPAEDNHLLRDSQRAGSRASVLTTTTTTSEHPSLPEIQDTGGLLDVPENSRISIPPQFPEFVPEEMSPTTAGHPSHMFDRNITGQSMGVEQQRQSTSSSQLRTSETATPTEDGSTPGLQSPEQKRITKRQNIINELINTEISFHRDMTVVEDIYMGTTNSCEALREDDIKILFANTPAIVKFSRAFADVLKENSRGVYQKPAKDKRPTLPQSKPSEVNGRPASLATTNSGYTEAFSEGTDDERDRRSRIGHVFVEHLSKMEKVFAEYLKNHEAANKKLQELIQLEEVKVWMHECETYARDLSNAWNLDAMLIKPTQRLMKYPLLLDDLFKATPQDHPDYTALEMASKELRHMSYRINEAKKRADLIDRVVNPGKGTERRDISERLGNLMKGRTDKVKQNVGTLEHVEDPEYVALSQKFGSQHLQLQVVMKDMEMHRTNGEASIKRLVSLADGWCGVVDVGASPSPEIESKWRRWAQAIQELRMFAWADHVIAVERHCIQPIKTCLSLFDRPQNLIKERKKRLPQYANFRAKRESGSSVKEDLQQQADQFMALNDTLKDELPRLYKLSAKLVEECLKNWIDLTGMWNSVAQRKLQTVIDDLNNSSFNQIVETFHSDHQYGITDITSLAICNGSLQNDTSNFLASSANSVKSDGRVSSRPSYGDSRRGPSFENPYDWRQPSFETQRASGGSTNPRPSTDNGRPGWPSGANHQRLRSHSGSNAPRIHTSHGQPPPLPPAIPSAGQPHSTSFFWQKTPPLNTASAQNYESAGSNRYYANAPSRPWDQHAPAPYRQEMQQTSYSGRPSASESTLVGSYHTPGSSLTAVNSAHSSRTHTFSSAVPMSDNAYRSTSPRRTFSGSRSIGDAQQQQQQPQQRVLWLAASLFDFKLDTARKEAGYPYLTYDPGEIFDVIGERGELWLARNQDDPNGPVGWIWEKHFAKLINDDS